MMRVAVFGAGAIGAYFGARLAKGGADVHLIARGRHLDALRSNGLTIVAPPEATVTRKLPATDDPADVGPVDVVLFCVKSYDTDEAARRLGPLLQESTGVVSLQNGIDNEDRIAAAIGWPHVLGGAAYIFGAIREPGVVTVAGPRKIVLGEWSGGPPSSRVRAILEVAERAGLPAEASHDVRVAKWEKYTLLAAFSAMSAATRLPIGDIRRAPAAMTMLEAMMGEVWAVGRAIGVALADDLVERQFNLLGSQTDDAAASLYHDLVTGHRMEVEALQGAVVRLGRANGVATPFLDAAYAILEPWAIRNDQRPEERSPIPD